MQLFNQTDTSSLLKTANWDEDYVPLQGLFGLGTSLVWLLTGIDKKEPIAFTLCDRGKTFPGLGYVNINELTSVGTPWVKGIERDPYFEGRVGISFYVEAARICQYITHDAELLQYLETAKNTKRE